MTPTQKLLSVCTNTTEIAKIESSHLRETMNKFVTAAFKSIDKLEDEVIKTRTDIRNLESRIGKIDPEEYGRQMYVLSECHKMALANFAQANREFEQYMDEQKQLFMSKGLPAERAWKEMIIPTGTMVNRFGQTIQTMVIVPRAQDLAPVDTDEDDGSERSVRASHSYSDSVGVSRDQKRGKYNDAALLIEQAAMSVDASEVVPFASACV